MNTGARLSFSDTQFGRTDSAGTWTLCDEHGCEIGHVQGVERLREGRSFISEGTSPADALAIARRIDPTVVAVLDDELGREGYGWKVLYEREAGHRAARYAETEHAPVPRVEREWFRTTAGFALARTLVDRWDGLAPWTDHMAHECTDESVLAELRARTEGDGLAPADVEHDARTIDELA